MLTLSDVRKAYSSPSGEIVRAVDGVSLTIRRGELVALYGPSGSGKTTLLNIIAGILRPDSGRVAIDDRDLATLGNRELADYRLRSVGFIPQTASFVPGVRAVDQAALKLYGEMRRRDARRRVEPLLVMLGLGERLQHRSEQLSGGEKQRVLIARALAVEPSIVLADEPTGNLDSRRSDEVLALLSRLTHEHRTATLLVTHDPQAAKHADRVLELHDGRVRDFNVSGV